MSIVLVDAKSGQVLDSSRRLRSQAPNIFYQLADPSVRRRSPISMAEFGGVRPPTFAGKREEDADAFVKAFERYTKFKEITDGDKKLNLFAVLLHGSAADWFDALPDTAKDNFAHLSASFAQRYQLTDSLKYKSASDLFTKKQSDNESADEFVTRMRKLARLVEVDDKILQFALINGFRPHIAAHVTQCKSDTVDKILEAARLAELAFDRATVSDSAVCQQLADMNAEMRRLAVKVDRATTTTAVSRSPTPERRVRFTRPASPVDVRRSTTVQDGGRRPTDGNRSGRDASFQRQTYNEQQPRRDHQQPREATRSCTRCARNHGINSYCPARDPNKCCNYCKKHGHFEAACFLKAKNQRA